MSSARPRFDTSINYYQVLDVPFGATKDEITRAYRNLIRLTHPDKFQDPDARAKAEERTKLLNAAYAVLSRPPVRQEYDKVVRASAMSEALMQRYTGNQPGRSQQATRPPPRPPAPHVVRAQRRAYNSAVRQILGATAVFVAVIFGLLLVTFAAVSALRMVF